MNITLTGNLGSGKSSICKELAKMGYEIISTGSIFREIAKEKNMSVTELNELVKSDRTIDNMIDNRSINLGKEKDNVIFDSRLAWHFIPDSFKVFVTIDIREAAHRVFTGENRQAEEYDTEEDALNKLKQRAELEKDRYMSLYNIDYFDASNYNLIIDSTNVSANNIAREIVRNYNIYKEHQ